MRRTQNNWKSITKNLFGSNQKWVIQERLNVVTEEASKESFDTDCPQNVSEWSIKEINFNWVFQTYEGPTKTKHSSGKRKLEIL